MTLPFLTPFAGYLIAEESHVSGVLAVLSPGLFLTLRASESLPRQSHLQTINVWNVVTYKYETRIDRLRLHDNVRRSKAHESEVRETLRIQLEIIPVERNVATQLRRKSNEDDEALQTILYELHLEESRLLMGTMR